MLHVAVRPFYSLTYIYLLSTPFHCVIIMKCYIPLGSYTDWHISESFSLFCNNLVSFMLNRTARLIYSPAYFH